MSKLAKRTSRRNSSKDGILKKLGAAVTRVVRSKTSAPTSKKPVNLKWRAAALKAWRTRRARAAQKPAISRASVPDAFARLDLAKNQEARLLIIRLLRMGVDPVILEKATGLGRQTFAAYRAHATMGTYDHQRAQA